MKMKKAKYSTPDLREKLVKDMISKVETICEARDCHPDNSLLRDYVNRAVDQYIDDWYEVSLEAIDLMEGGADFVTDDEIDDPEVIGEAKRRVIKAMYEDRPPDTHERIALSIIENIGNSGRNGAEESTDI